MISQYILIQEMKRQATIQLNAGHDYKKQVT